MTERDAVSQSVKRQIGRFAQRPSRRAVGRRRTWLWWALAGAVALWLLWMTLRPNQTVAADLSSLTEPAAAQGISVHFLIELAGNVVVFIPLGVALALALGSKAAGRRLLLATLLGAGLSLCIELLQTVLPTRVAALDDLLLNTAGTAIGALVVCWIHSMFATERSTEHHKPRLT